LARRLETIFPEKRLFLKSDDSTRFVRLTSSTQAALALGGTALLGWTAFASAMVLIAALGSGDARDQALYDQKMYAERLNALSIERDARAREARAAQERFTLALEQVSRMQSQLLASEEKRTELETGVSVVQSTLRAAMAERDAARAAADEAARELAALTGSGSTESAQLRDLEQTLAFLTTALSGTAVERDGLQNAHSAAVAEIEELLLTQQLTAERNNRVFEILEDAVSVSVAPLERMFEEAGVPAQRILDEIRRTTSGQGGPLVPMSLSTRSLPQDELSYRTKEILAGLDRLNLHRMAVDQLPFAMPVKASFRFTSPFGYRRDPKGAGTRMHKGTDFAASLGTPIYATAEGVVTEAGWHSGFGRMVKIRHSFGYETVYAHMSKLRVKEGQRVSRGDRIGDMGSTGRSTGVHLHYEVHQSGKPVNPMSFIKAGKNVL
jgi:murein DD-endopeptidase MepM/ murein hydrolase activator NlpD